MTTWTSGDLIANGIKIHYTRTRGNKPPVVLLHGMTDNGLCWTRVAQALEADYDLMMPDARGHGLSDGPPSGYNYPELAADVVGLIQALKLERPVLIGHSMGASTAATVMADHPQAVRAAILEDPPFRNQKDARPPDWAEGFLSEIWQRKTQSREELIAVCHQQSSTWDEAELGPWADSKLQVSPNIVELIRTPPAPWQETAQRISGPVLLITGDPELGAIVTPEVASEALGFWPHGQVVRLHGAGHSIHREQFEPYMQAVRAFLAEMIGKKRSV